MLCVSKVDMSYVISNTVHEPWTNLDPIQLGSMGLFVAKVTADS